MSRLTRDETTETVSRDQVLGANADREIFIFPIQLTSSRIGNLTRLILTLAICDDYINIHTSNYFTKQCAALRDSLHSTAKVDLQFIRSERIIIEQAFKRFCQCYTK